MRKSLLVVVSLTVGLFASAAQAECSKVIEIPLAALSEKPETVQPALDCLAFRAQLVQAQNVELVAARREAVGDGLTVYVLRFTPGGQTASIDRLDNANKESVEHNRDEYDQSGQYTEEIWPDSPFHRLAVSAYDDFVSRKGEVRPKSFTDLIDQVASSSRAVIAMRWPVPTKFADTVVKASGK